MGLGACSVCADAEGEDRGKSPGMACEGAWGASEAIGRFAMTAMTVFALCPPRRLCVGHEGARVRVVAGRRRHRRRPESASQRARPIKLPP